MESTSHPGPGSLQSALDDVKRAGSRLVEAYVEAGTSEVLNAGKRVALAKFSAIALSALAIGLSLYGLCLEFVQLGLSRLWLGHSPELYRLMSHAVLFVLFAGIGLFLVRNSRTGR